MKEDPSPDPTPSPTPLGTCDAHKGLLPHSGHDDICINWRPLPEPSPGTERKEGRASDESRAVGSSAHASGEVDKVSSAPSSPPAEGLEPPRTCPECGDDHALGAACTQDYQRTDEFAAIRADAIAAEDTLALEHPAVIRAMLALTERLHTVEREGAEIEAYWQERAFAAEAELARLAADGQAPGDPV